MDPNFHCAEGKLASIIKVILNNRSVHQMKQDMLKANSISLFHDTTTLHNTKILVIMVKYYDPLGDVQVRCLDLVQIIHETADDISRHIQTAMRNAGIDNHKVKGLVADNTNSNFGGSQHKGKQNVATVLENDFKHGLFRLGCLGHVDNNAFKKVAAYLKSNNHFDLDRALNLPFGFFNQKVKIRDEFVRHWQSQGHSMKDFKPMRSYGDTRWLSALHALKNLNFMLPELTKFVSNKSKERNASAPTLELNEFCSKEINHCWVELLTRFVKECHRVAELIQGRQMTIMSGQSVILSFVSFCSPENRSSSISQLTTGEEMNQKMSTISQDERDSLIAATNEMLDVAFKYLEMWLKPYEQLICFKWASLEATISANQVLATLKLFQKQNPPVPTIEPIPSLEQIQEELDFVNSMIERITTNSAKLTTTEKWTFIFTNAKSKSVELPILESLCCDILCMSPSNALSETIFSELTHFWSNSKSNIDFKSIKAYINIRYNLTDSFDEFIYMALTNREFLDSIRSGKKYHELMYDKETSERIDIGESFAPFETEIISDFYFE